MQNETTSLKSWTVKADELKLEFADWDSAFAYANALAWKKKLEKHIHLDARMIVLCPPGVLKFTCTFNEVA